MTVTITDHRGARLTGQVKCWMGRRIVEIETPDGSRHTGRLAPDSCDDPARALPSTVDGAQ